MKCRTLLVALAALCLSVLTPALAQEKPLSLKEISAYLNTLLNVQSEFIQTNADGTVSNGRFYLKRPGRMRFEYDPPNKALVVAGQGKLAFFDDRSNAGPQQYSLRRTPLSIILQKKVDLEASNMVVSHLHDGTATTIILQDPKHPNYGNVQLVFTDKPTVLDQWIVTDESGQQTKVVLGELNQSKRLSARLFDITELIKENSPTR